MYAAALDFLCCFLFLFFFLIKVAIDNVGVFNFAAIVHAYTRERDREKRAPFSTDERGGLKIDGHWTDCEEGLNENYCSLLE